MSLFPSLLFGFPCGFLLLFTFLPLYCFIFYGLDLLKKAGTLWEEAQKLEMEAQHLMACGLENMEVAVAGLQVEGFYGLLRGAMSHSSMSPAPPSHKKVSLTPSTTISHPPPLESKEPEAPGPAEQALESTSSTAPSVPEGEILTNMQPLHIQLGGIKRVYRCQVEGCREDPSTSHATICTHMHKVHFGWGWCVPSATSPSSTLTPSGITRRVT